MRYQSTRCTKSCLLETHGGNEKSNHNQSISHKSATNLLNAPFSSCSCFQSNIFELCLAIFITYFVFVHVHSSFLTTNRHLDTGCRMTTCNPLLGYVYTRHGWDGCRQKVAPILAPFLALRILR